MKKFITITLLIFIAVSASSKDSWKENFSKPTKKGNDIYTQFLIVVDEENDIDTGKITIQNILLLGFQYCGEKAKPNDMLYVFIYEVKTPDTPYIYRMKAIYLFQAQKNVITVDDMFHKAEEMFD
jgi:hypothetical protein